MSHSLPDCTPGPGRSCRARNTYHWCNGKMALLPRGFLRNICNFSERSVHKCPPFQVSSGTDRNRCKIYIADPPPLLSWICQLGPKVLCSPKGFMRLHCFACSHHTHLTLWLKETDFRNLIKKPPEKRQVATRRIFPCNWHPPVWLLNPIFLNCLCMCAPVEPAEVTLLGSFTAVEGQDLDLTCSASSSNPPVQIRWWLGHKELNASAVTLEEVRLVNSNRRGWKRFPTELLLPGLCWCLKRITEAGCVCLFVKTQEMTEYKTLPFSQMFLYSLTKGKAHVCMNDYLE